MVSEPGGTMDREIVIGVLLLVALTWLLYKLIVFLEPRE
jgi:hypothetical protein